MCFAMDCFLAGMSVVLMVAVMPGFFKAEVGLKEFFILSIITSFFLFALTNFVISLSMLWSFWR